MDLMEGGDLTTSLFRRLHRLSVCVVVGLKILGRPSGLFKVTHSGLLAEVFTLLDVLVKIQLVRLIRDEID